MFTSRNKKVALAALIVSIVLAMQLTPPTQLNASDHIDAPALAQDHASDINDVYAFLDPNDNSRVVIILTINPFIISSEAIGQAIFDNTARYRIEIENTGDARPDQFINVTFTRGIGRGTTQTAIIELPNGQTFSAPTTVTEQGDTPAPLVITSNPPSGALFYAGSFDDPFFLDNTAANRFVISSLPGPGNPGNPDRGVFARRAAGNADDTQTQGPGRDTYSGFNTLGFVLSVPVTS